MIPLTGLGLVLRRSKRAEDDFRLTVFLRDVGKILVLAKGVHGPKSKLRSLLEPFTEADYNLFVPPDNGVSARLAGGKLLDSHQGLRRNYEAYHSAARMVETVDVLVPYRAPAPDVYDILRASLQALSVGRSAPEEWVLFVAHLLPCLGHGDVTERLLALIEPFEREAAGAALGSPTETDFRVRPASLDRCQTLVDAELERILPWRLKSDRTAEDVSKEILQ